MNVAASAALLLLVLGFSGGAWHLWTPHTPAIIPAGRFPIAAGLLLATFACARSLIKQRRFPRLHECTDPVVWSLGLVAFFCSEWLVRPWGFFADPFSRGPIIVGVILFAWLLTLRWSLLLKLWAIGSVALLIATFVSESRGELLLADDHAMFLFRLKLLKEHFPFIPFWSPLWNTGFDARDFFATGALNAFLISSPLVYLFPVESVYNVIIIGILWVLVPGCSYAASRILGGNRTASCIAALLACSLSLIWYRWALKYGTIGFITSTGLLPLVVALALRFIESPKPCWRDCLVLALLSTLMFLWSPSVLAVLPLGIVAFLRLPRLIASPRHILTALLLVCLNAPWVSMMWTVSNVESFLNAEGSGAPSAIQAPATEEQARGEGDEPAQIRPPTQQSFRHRKGSLDTRRAMQELHTQATATNPLLVIFAIPAILALGGRKRLTYALTAAWLLFLGTFGVSLKPQLELDRMGTIAAMLCVVPVSAYLVRLFESAATSKWRKMAAVLAGGFLLASPLSASTIIQNRSRERYQFEDEQMKDLATFLKDRDTPGRAFFSGCILHEVNGAHIAPVALWANKQLVATSYAHNIWQYTQPIPESFLERKAAGIREYLDMVNATIVFAHEEDWINLFRHNPGEYREVYSGPKLRAFERTAYQPTFFLQGDGREYSFTSGSVSFTPLTERVVLKLKHFPFLKSTQCELKPFRAAPELELVELTGCTPGIPVTIASVSPLERLMAPRGPKS
jgi:hypothetical protein